MIRCIARLGDRTIGICKCHKKPIIVGGTIVSASGDSFTDNRGIARLGDMVRADCGHTGIIISASILTWVDLRGVARMGDKTTGCYTANIITSSSNSFTL